MKRSFIIDGEHFEINVVRIRSQVDLIETTSFSDRSRHWIPSDSRILELYGTTVDGLHIEGTFQVRSRTPDGILVIERCRIG